MSRKRSTKNRKRFNKKRTMKMLELQARGLNRAEIGHMFDVSGERVRQIIGNRVLKDVECKWCEGIVAPSKSGPIASVCSPSCRKNWWRHGVSLVEHDRDTHSAALAGITVNAAPPNERGCWEWCGYCNNLTGYGQMRWDGKTEGAHRVMYKLTIGEIPQGLCVLHHCDNPKCVNPKHLYLGTYKDNARDREVRRRSNRGHRFSPTDVIDIRRDYRGSNDLPEFASRYDVSVSTIRALVVNKTYRTDRRGRLLTDSMVRRTRDLYLRGNHTYKSLAMMYHVSVCTMRDVLRGRKVYQDIS